jgi:diguanylate cyclase (GGDEF)-like protein
LEFAMTREALASLYDETPVATLLCEPHALRVVSANAAAQALLGRSASDLTGRAWSELVGDAERIEGALRAALAGARSSIGVDLRGTEATVAHVECDVLPARAGEQIVGAFVHVRTEGPAMHDALTGLPSGAVLDDRIEQALVTARRYRYRFAILEADVDGFGSITQRHGASAGDWVLRIIGQRIREALRESDTVVRTEADRFVVLQPLVESVDDAVDVAHKIVFAMHAPIALEGRALDVRVSLGVAVFPLDGESRDALRAAAHGALLDAKQKARGLLCLATSSATERAS